MIELRFHRELYDGKAIDAAIKTFADYAHFEQSEEPSHFIVRVTAKDSARERRIAGELGNYALGLTVKSGSTGEGTPS